MNSRIRELRENAGDTQADLAAKLKLTKNFISLIETGSRKPSDRTVQDICRIYGVSEKWLRTGEGERKVPADDELDAFFASIMAGEPDSVQRRWAEAFRTLTPYEWRLIDEIIDKLSDANRKRG